MVQLFFLMKEEIKLAFKLKDKCIIANMPKIGDVIIKDKGEVKDNFEIIEEHEYYFVGIAQRLKFKECFTKTSFALKEFKILRKQEPLIEGAV